VYFDGLDDVGGGGEGEVPGVESVVDDCAGEEGLVGSGDRVHDVGEHGEVNFQDKKAVGFRCRCGSQNIRVGNGGIRVH
jgi:hypothetical protein